VPPPPLVVGFDLDATLVDSAAGISACLRLALDAVGAPVDEALLAASVGLPLESILAGMVPASAVPAAVAAYRAAYPGVGLAGLVALPGATQTLEAVRADGATSLVVTAKPAAVARQALSVAGLDVDEVVGECFGADKGAALAAAGAVVYVGDHPGDMLGATVGGAVALGVTTGHADAAALRAAGADHVLAGLGAFPAWWAQWLLDARLTALDSRLRELGSVLVALSAGADSVFLLAAAVASLGPARVAAGTAVSPSLPDAELAEARRLAEALGVRHLRVDTHELDRPGYVANGRDRCAFCKTELVDSLAPVAAAHGLAVVATGTNADDARDPHRPGVAAAAAAGAVAPLREVGLTKPQVRAASRAWGLPTWDKPAAACLASRVAYGVPVTRERLERVGAAEDALRAGLADAGLRVDHVRVRDLGGRARVEVDPAAVGTLAARPDLLRRVAAAGFAEVELDPRGYRSGALNEVSGPGPGAPAPAPARP